MVHKFFLYLHHLRLLCLPNRLDSVALSHCCSLSIGFSVLSLLRRTDLKELLSCSGSLPKFGLTRMFPWGLVVPAALGVGEVVLWHGIGHDASRRGSAF